MEYVDCVVDPDYEISVAYPYVIRKKSNGHIVSESDRGNGYIRCQLNGKDYSKHRIVAMQFVENDDPDHKTEVDHIDGDRSNNWVSNLRWTTRSENLYNRSRSSRGNREFTFLDELPEEAESFDSYNGHDFDGLFIDYNEQKLYLFNGVRYRELVPCRSGGSLCYWVYDIEGKQRRLSHKILFG